VGGALFSNAGAFGQSIGDVLKEAVLLGTDGREDKVKREDFGFSYRRSFLQQSHGVVVEAVLAVSPGDGKSSDIKVRDYLERRRTKHPPWGTACAGSFFKNPCSRDGQKVAAGWLLEQAGAKGLSVGGAAVYEGHCNFIVNTGTATAEDVRRLAEELKERVLKTSGIQLEEEVVYLPATASML
jgi:UDP-N-acetylmuramate dehydrogenase